MTEPVMIEVNRDIFDKIESIRKSIRIMDAVSADSKITELQMLLIRQMSLRHEEGSCAD